MDRKMSARELWGDSETDNVSETDWDQKKGYSTAGEESPVENIAQEDISSPENGSETESEGDDVESSGSNYESSSSFERRKQELKMKKMKALHNTKAAKSATSKQAAASRKQKHNMSKERAYVDSPRSVYAREKFSTGQKSPNKRKIVVSSPSEESSSEMEFEAPPKVPSTKKVPPKKKAAKVSVEKVVDNNIGKKPAKGTKLPAKRIDMQFAGDMRAGVPIVDSRPGKNTLVQAGKGQIPEEAVNPRLQRCMRLIHLKFSLPKKPRLDQHRHNWLGCG